MKLFVFVSLILLPVLSWSATDRAGLCFSRMNVHAGNPMSRDRERSQCVKALAPTLNRETCLKHTRAFEYSINAEGMKAYCVFELRGDPRPADCLAAARTMDYGGSRDELVWGCLKRLKETVSKNECKQLARAMTFPAQKTRASSYCENEIRASYR